MKFKNIVLSDLSRTKIYETVIDIKTLIAPVRSKRKKETGNIIVIPKRFNMRITLILKRERESHIESFGYLNI